MVEPPSIMQGLPRCPSRVPMRYQVSMEISVSDRNRAPSSGKALSCWRLRTWTKQPLLFALSRPSKMTTTSCGRLKPRLPSATRGRSRRAGLFPLDRNTYEPTDPVLAELHKVLCKLRDKVYAHTDKDGGRSAAVLVRTDPVELPGRSNFSGRKIGLPMPRDSLPVALELVDIQRTRFPQRGRNAQALG
jgi:hypothetical protein